MAMAPSGKVKVTEPPSTSSGGWVAAAMVLISVVLPLLEFAGQAVDLARRDREADIVDRPHVARHAERRGPVIGAQAFDGEDRRHRSVRPSRLRGSMYSFIETASRKSPMKVMTTSSTGKKIHHQMPATSAVC